MSIMMEEFSCPSSRERSSMQERNSRPLSVHDTATAPSDLLNLHEIVAKARQNLNQNDWDYIVGGVESETTLRRNRMALDAIAFRPRVLRCLLYTSPSPRDS